MNDKQVKIGIILANLAKFRAISGSFWPKVKFRAFLAIISCPMVLKFPSAISFKFRAFSEISANMATLVRLG